MKGFTKRLWAFLMVLVLLVGLLPVVQISATAATVDYVYSADGYIYNWGTRETDATFLSPNAEAFYTDGYTYDDLSVLSGAEETDAVPSSELYTTLQKLMTDNHTWINNYDDESKPLFQYTDCQGSALLDDSISTFYVGSSVGPAWDSGATWNREHVWPQSKGLDGSDEDDIMMLRPADASVNSSRSNKAFGEGTDYYHPNGESDGTYDVRGDVARIALYVYVRWGNTEKLWGTSGVIESKEILLQWMQEDPVDTWELGRNDSVESITGTRNVFVDYPELAFTLFGEDVPADMVTPSGEAVAAGMDYTITPETNDAAMGTVSVSGNVINAFPAEGYYAESYTVTSGTATVTQNGNAFTVEAAADCTVQINFAVLEQVSVSFQQNGVTVSSDQYDWNEPFALREHTGEVADGYYFAGWSYSPISGTESASGIYQAGEAYTPTADIVFHAVYAYLDKSADPEAGEWTLVTDASQLYAGNEVVIAAKAYSAVAGEIATGNVYMNKVSASFLENWIPELPADAQVLTLGGHEGAWTLSNADGALLGANTSKNLLWDAGITTWNISVADGTLTMGDVDGACGTIQYNASSPRFKVYAPGQQAAQLYVYDTDAGTLHYTTQLADPCAHTNTVAVPEQAATETEIGWSAGIYCYDCGKYVEGHEKLAPAGASCTVNFVVPNGVTAIPNTLCDADGITLPEAKAPEGYTFAGWTETPVDNATEQPDILTAGSIYKTYSGDSTVLYALYTYEEAGTKTIYKLAESPDVLTVGDKVVIAAASYDFALSTTQNGNNRGRAEITKNDDGTITFGDDVAVLTLETGYADGTYAFYTGADGYLYAAGANSNNYLRTGTTLNDKSSFKISVTDGIWSITANITGRNDLRYNNTNKIFSCYATGGQNAVCLYVEEKLDGETVTYYTTVIGDECAHEVTDFSSAVAATCTTKGWTGELLCDDCGEVLAESQQIAPTGHVSAAFVPAREGSCETAGWEAHYECAECDACYLTKAAEAEEYVKPTAAGHDYTADLTTCGTCGHVRITLKLTTVNLRSSSASLYYKGEFTFDEETAASILSYGITASLYDTEPTVDDSETSKYTVGTTGALIANIMDTDNTTSVNNQNARMPVYARAYVQLSDGSYVYSDVVSVSLRQMVQAVDSQLWDSLSDAQKDALAGMYETFADEMAYWTIPNLKAYITAK